jgi:membrane fusion protein, type I secretion system
MTGHRSSRYGSARPMTIVFLAIGLLVGGVMFWGASTEIAGAVVASGEVAVENNRQIVQHADGGVVGAILARDGDLVRAGDTLVRLDGVELNSDLAVIDTELFEVRARRARLEAERDAWDSIDFPASLASGTAVGAGAPEQVAGQQALFDARRYTSQRVDAQIGERIRQIRN